MPQRREVSRKASRPELGRVALSAAILALGLCSHVSLARAADADDSNKSVGDKFLGVLGLKNPFAPQYDINYSARSPLVVPPSRNLPPPVAAGPPKTPNWPKDPDITGREAAKKAEKPAPHTDWQSDLARPLRPDELNVPGPNTRAASAGKPDLPPQPPPKKSLFSFDWLNPNKEEYATFIGEPSRTSLTDPPPGYLTPSPDQPYGIGKEHVTPHVQTLGERMEPVR